MSGRTCPGWREDGSFDADGCRWHEDDDTGALLAEFEDTCRCTTDCGDPGEAGCCYCNHTDVYDPCPVIGYGCGMNARPYLWRGRVEQHPADRCDCCTDAQWAAAATPTAQTLAAMTQGASS